jgi:hypothetical protein
MNLLNTALLNIKIHSIEYVISCLVLFGIIAIISSVFKKEPPKVNSSTGPAYPHYYRKEEITPKWK